MAAVLRTSASFQAVRASALRAGSVAAPSRVALRSPGFCGASASCSLKSDFAPTNRVTSSFCSDIAGSSLLPENRTRLGFRLSPGRLVVRAGGISLGCTKRHASRKKRARVSGYRVRISTTDGINVLKRRRAKGRKVLVTQSSSRTGKRA